MNLAALGRASWGAFVWPVLPTGTVERFGWTLLHSLWQFAIVAGLLGCWLRVGARRDPAARYTAAGLAMLGMVALSVLTFVRAAPREPGLSANPSVAATSSVADSSAAGLAGPWRIRWDGAAGAVQPQPDLAKPAPHTTPATTAQAKPFALVRVVLQGVRDAWQRPSSTWLQTLVVFWLAGVSILALRPLAGLAHVHRLGRAGRSPPPSSLVEMLQRTALRLGIVRPVALAQSTRVTVPAVMGVWRPLILLPVSSICGLPPAHLEAILAHELAHIRRHDYLVNLGQLLVETLFFYHPAVWWVSRQIRVEREHCCDDIAAALQPDRGIYAEALLALDGLRRRELSPAMAAAGGSLIARVRRLATAPQREATIAAWWYLVFAVPCGALVLLIASLDLSFAPARAAQAPAAAANPGQPAGDAPQDAPGAGQPAAESPRGDRKILARVRGTKGGLAGAKVVVNFLSTEPSSAELKVRQVANYVTDHEGKYSILVPAELAGRRDVQLTVAVAHPGYLERTLGPVPVDDFTGRRIRNEEGYWLYRQLARQAILDTYLRAGTQLSARVFTHDGAPAAGAKVIARTKYRAYSWKFHSADEYDASDWAITDAAGRFEILFGDPATIVIDLPGHAPLVVDRLTQEQLPAEFRLPRPHELRGRVVNAQGDPLPGAIVSVVRDFAWNEFDMPQALGQQCAARADGRYEMPPLPAGDYRISVTARVRDADQIDEYNARSQRPARPGVIVFSTDEKRIETDPLPDVILEERITLGDSDRVTCDLRGAKTVLIEARVVFPQGPPAQRQSDLGVSGLIQGVRWSGGWTLADDDGLARLKIPQGLTGTTVDTGLALAQLTPDGPAEICEAVHLGVVRQNTSGIIVTKPLLAKLRVKLNLPPRLDQQITDLKRRTFINIHAHHLREGFDARSPARKTIGLAGAMQTNADQYRGTALPNEPIVLRVTKTVDKVETRLHEEQLILTPGEDLLRTIDIQDRN